jgi:hypothetical protein
MVSVADFVVLPKSAEIRVGVAVVTALVVTVNVAVVAPAGTFTLDGTVVATLLVASTIDKPAAGAALPRVTVPVELTPPVTLVGFTLTPASEGGFTLRAAVFTAPFRLAEMVTDTALGTAVVLMLKLAEFTPAGTVIDDATAAAALPLDKAMTRPPAGAGPLRVREPVETCPPVTLFGLSASVFTMTCVAPLAIFTTKAS